MISFRFSTEVTFSRNRGSMVDNRSSLKAVLTDWDGATLDLRWDPYKATVMPVLHTGTCTDAEGPPDFESRGASTDYSDASSECGSSSGEDCLDVQQQQQQQEEEEEKEKEEVTFPTSSLSPRAAATPRTATSLQHRPPDALLTRAPTALDSDPDADADAEAASLSGASDTRRDTLSITSPHAAGAQDGLVVGYPTELVVSLAAVRRRRLSGSHYAPSVRAVTERRPRTSFFPSVRPRACTCPPLLLFHVHGTLAAGLVQCGHHGGSRRCRSSMSDAVGVACHSRGGASRLRSHTSTVRVSGLGRADHQ